MTDQQIEQLIRADRDLITAIVPDGSVVLDLGCGDGALLARLIGERGVKGCGVDIAEHNLIRCVERGLSVSQGDLDEGLGDFSRWFLRLCNPQSDTPGYKKNLIR